MKNKIYVPEPIQCGLVLLAFSCLVRLVAPQAVATTACGVTKGCFKIPTNCDGIATSCDVIVTWQQTPDGQSLIFELAGVSNGYLAVGFSHNRLMSNTDVLACVSNNDEVTVKRFYNPVSHVNEARSKIGVSDETASSVDGIVQCRFTRVKYIEGHREFADLQKKKYVMLAKGRQTGGFLTYHVLGRHISEAKTNFSTYQAPRDVITAFPYTIHETSDTPSTSSKSDVDTVERKTDAFFSKISAVGNRADRRCISVIAVAVVMCLQTASFGGYLV